VFILKKALQMKNKKIVLAVCGSVAAIESPKLARELVRKGFDVECVMSKAAQGIISQDVMCWATGKEVITSITGKMDHVRLCGMDGEASILLICPATSNTISKIASGIDDTAVTTFAATALGSKTRVLIAPAMHHSMYKNPFVAENIKRLMSAGIELIDPRIEEKKAKVASIEDIIKAVQKASVKQ